MEDPEVAETRALLTSRFRMIAAAALHAGVSAQDLTDELDVLVSRMEQDGRRPVGIPEQRPLLRLVQ